VFGGAVTIIINLLMLGYVIILIRKVITREDDAIQYWYPDGAAELGEVSYREAYSMMFFQLTTAFRHGEARDGAHQNIELEELYQHVDMKFEQIDVDMENEDPAKRVRYTPYEARLCKEEDFGDHPKNREAWQRFKNSIILCPDVEKDDDLML